MRNLTHRWIQLHLVRAIFSMFKKGQGRPTPLIPLLVVQLSDEKKVQEDNVEVNLVPEWFINGYAKTVVMQKQLC